MSEELVYWLALDRAPLVGATTFNRLLQQFGSPEAVFRAEQRQLLQFGLKAVSIDYIRQPDWKAAADDLAWIRDNNSHIITINDPDYPSNLRAIHAPPPLLYVRGDLTVLHKPQIAIVGTRNPSHAGYELAGLFANQLVDFGFVIVSGLASGIDEAAHWGALEGNGNTIAVMGTGLNRIYPAKNHNLAHKMVQQGGALVSEFSPLIAAKHENFPRRNRTISGMSLGVVVVEAGKNSGALITARMAMEQGREVFAVPGSIHSEVARGCHALIKQGAKLVENTQDILNEILIHVPAKIYQQTLPIVKQVTNLANTDNLDPQYQIVLDYMGNSPISIDSLVDKSNISAEDLSSMLLILELKGLVSSRAGGLYIRNIGDVP
jgi:DNA processing protein